MKQIIVYLAVFLLTLYCFFLYDDEIITIMLVVEAVYLIISFLWLGYFRGKIDVTMNSLIPIAEKKQKIPVIISICNRSKLFKVHVKVLIQVENLFTGEKKKITKAGTVGANKREAFTVELTANCCGNIAISLEKYFIFDLLYILNMKKNSREVQYVGILPECHLVPVEISRRTREFIAEADEYFDKERGEDPSEVYQIREYRAMDSLRDVHWKMSAKADELLVKEHGKPKGCVVLIWLNLQADLKRSRIVPTVILEAVASLSMSLLEAECVHMVAWYEKENKRIEKKRVSKEENIYELLNRLLYTRVYEDEIQEQYEDAFRGISFSSVVEIKADGSIFVNEEEKMKLSLEEGKTKWDELYFML